VPQIRVVERRCHAVDFRSADPEALGLGPPRGDGSPRFVRDPASRLAVDSEVLGDLKGKIERCCKLPQVPIGLCTRRFGLKGPRSQAQRLCYLSTVAGWRFSFQEV
jgi:hypothetical protein